VNIEQVDHQLVLIPSSSWQVPASKFSRRGIEKQAVDHMIQNDEACDIKWAKSR
jgi:hypothetical protein